MDRSNASILFSLLSGIALFLYIAYSAIGTIKPGQPDNYFAFSQGVDFHDGISNAPAASSSYTGYDQSDISIPDYSPNNNTYTASNNSDEETHAAYANKLESSAEQNNTKTSGETKSNFAALSLNSQNSKQSASQTASTGEMQNVSSLTTDGTLGAGATRQSVNRSGNGFGGTDPGGDPTGPPVPVGDGLAVLLFLTGIYSLWKSGTKIKQLLISRHSYLFFLKNKNVRA